MREFKNATPYIGMKVFSRDRRHSGKIAQVSQCQYDTFPIVVIWGSGVTNRYPRDGLKFGDPDLDLMVEDQSRFSVIIRTDHFRTLRDAVEYYDANERFSDAELADGAVTFNVGSPVAPCGTQVFVGAGGRYFIKKNVEIME